MTGQIMSRPGVRRPGVRRRVAGLCAGLTAAVVLLSGCQVGEGSSSGLASQPTQSASGSGAAGSGSGSGSAGTEDSLPKLSWKRATASAVADPPVASFNPAAHDVFTGYTSPDRQSGSGSATPKGFSSAPAGAGMSRYLDQHISWTACGSFQCGTVLVPLDWDSPDGQAITLTMKRKQATERSGNRPAKGTMFINPGGPGVSGQDMLTSFETGSFPGYDVIAWDPRGSGQSTPVACGTAAQTDAFFDLDSSPDSSAQWSAVIAGNKAFAQQCRRASGALLDHISTIDTARDLDYLRTRVGDPKLNYLGISYGTFIGATYAEMYPGRVGRMVLDSAVNITSNDSVSQVMGFDKAFHAFAGWCARNDKECGLGGSADEVVRRTQSFLAGLDSRPLTVGSRSLTQNQAATGIAFYLYSGVDSYKYLAGALGWAMERGQGKYLLAAADSLNGRDVETGKWDNSAYAFPAILCKDSADPGLAGARAQWEIDQRRAPLLGRPFGVGLVCTYWTAKPATQLRISARGAAPIVVLGVTGDPATPYQQAQWMAQQMSSAVLVSWRGAGHSAWSLGNSCLRNSVTGYLNGGVVPRNGLTC